MKNSNEHTVWIVVPVFNRAEKIFGLINQIHSQAFQDFIFVIVDHGTVDIDYSLFVDSRIVVLRERPNLWWTGAVNVGVRYVIRKSTFAQDFILVINDDVQVGEDYLRSLVDIGVSNPKTIIGSICVNSNTNRVMYAGLSLNRLKARFVPKYSNYKPDEVPEHLISSDILPGRGMLIPLGIFKSIGLFNESKLPHYGADNEFSWRARKKGFELRIATNCRVFTESKEDAIYRFRSSFREFAMDKKKPGNLPAVISYSLLCFQRPYSVYYIGINFIRHLMSYIKRFLIRWNHSV